jgi:hypothetical protein
MQLPMPANPIDTWTTNKREYRTYQDSFYKRNLRPDEYRPGVGNKPYIPPLGYERLKNEAACPHFVRSNTDIPVPATLDDYDDGGGSFVLVTQRLLW